MLELTLLGAIASPAYLLAEYQCEPEFKDPIKRAFELIRVCSLLAESVKTMSCKIDDITISLKEFAVKVLDLCQGTSEARLFLAQVDDPEDRSITDTMLPPRINHALQLRFKDFVLHDYCQQFARDVFFGKKSFSLKNNRKSYMCSPRFQESLFLIFLMPLASISHSLSKFGIPCSFLGHYVELPANRMLSYASAYIFFVVLAILNLVNPVDTEYEIDWDWYNYIGLVFLISFLMFDLERMSQLASSAKVVANTNMIETGGVKLCAFFGNSYFTYRFLGHILYFCGISMEYMGYKYSAQLQKHLPHLTLDISHITKNKTINFTVDERETHYINYHPVRIGVCLEAFGLLIVMTHLLQYLCLHHVFGIVYVSLRKCISIVFSFALTYGVMVFAFYLSIYTVINSSRMSVEKQKPNDSILCTLDVGGEECFKKCSSQDEGSDGSFASHRKALKVVLWTLFDPENDASAVNCSEGLSRVVGQLLWFLYNLVAAVTLMNLLIALMGSCIR